MMRRNWKSVLSIGITSLLTSAAMPPLAVAQTRVSIGVTETMETYNPYGDSVALLYDLYSEVTGPFCSYNFATSEYEGRLAQRWEIKDPNTWVFYLDKRYTFNDGSPLPRPMWSTLWAGFSPPTVSIQPWPAQCLKPRLWTN